ncbi:MAG TPA: DinB family protein [Gemmatimonadaceae bacterium]
MSSAPEAWLRGPVDGVIPVLQPAAHALLQVGEEVTAAVDGLTPAQLWKRPGGAAAIGYHLLHIAGSTDRLLTYARGDALTRDQLAALAAERSAHDDAPALAGLLAEFAAAIESAMAQIRSTGEHDVFATREVGRQRLPSNTLGLIFHAAEHAARHAGQIVTLSKVVREGDTR